MNSDHALQNGNAKPQIRPNGRVSGTHTILGCESHFDVSAELAFKDGDLVTQDENLHVLVPIAHG